MFNFARDPMDADAAEAAKTARLEAERLTAERERADLAAVLELPEGRRYLWRVLGMSGIYRSSYTGDNDTFFREGERNIGLMIVGEIMRDFPGKFTEMVEEANDGHR